MKDWIKFAFAMPFFLAGLAWEWMHDYFCRGVQYYDWLNRE